MRELNFRAWDIHEKKMFTNKQLIIWNGNVYANDNPKLNANNLRGWSIDEKYLMQFTGLKDKNGKEVYEGDIIKDSEDFIAQVVYDKEYAGFGLNYQPFDLTDGLSVTFEELKNEYQNTFEIIGNIYEDPELLGGK